MKCTFSLPVPINEDPNVAVCTCQDCGAAILIVDFVGDDAKKIHEAWHERVRAMPKELYQYVKKEGVSIW